MVVEGGPDKRPRHNNLVGAKMQRRLNIFSGADSSVHPYFLTILFEFPCMLGQELRRASYAGFYAAAVV